MRKKNILIIYASNEYPTRNMIADLLYSFRDYSDYNIIYYNRFTNRLPKYLKRINYDAVILHQSVTFTTDYDRWRNKINDFVYFLEGLRCIKVALFQDEYVYTNLSVRMLNELKIDYAFTVAPKSEWQKIYVGLNEHTKLCPMLTGYVKKKSSEYYDKRLKSHRTIDIGYRAVWNKESIVLGRFGYDKIRIARVFQKHTKESGLKTNIKVGSQYLIKGKQWNKFLSSCRFFLGVESGSSMIDADGSIYKAVNDEIKKNPNVDVRTLYDNYVINTDGNLSLKAISPRHFEAIEEGACQILYEGEYSGILKPNVHYIELKKDHSNLKDVIDSLYDEDRRMKIVKKAYKDIIDSDKYTYESFVSAFFETIFDEVYSEKINSLFDLATIRFMASFHEKKVVLIIRIIQKAKKSVIVEIIRNSKIVKPLMRGYYAKRL